MATIIFQYRTRDGFALVADGKSRSLGKDEPDEINVQKIFQIQEQSAAYALIGTARFDDALRRGNPRQTYSNPNVERRIAIACSLTSNSPASFVT